MTRRRALVSLVAGAVALFGSACTSATELGADAAVGATAVDAPTEAVAESPAPPSATVAPTAEPTALEGPASESASERESESGSEPASLCGDAIPLIAGLTEDGFDTAGGQTAPIRAGICKGSDGALSFELRATSSGEQLSLPACQLLPDTWEAWLDNVSFVVVDERNSRGSTGGIITRRSGPDIEDMMMWRFDSDLRRSVNHQNSFDSPMCVGSRRLCTSSVGTDETLNLRIGPSLDADVLASIPGGSCALWEYGPADTDLDEAWAALVYSPRDGTWLGGFVSNDFVVDAPPNQVLDVHGVTNVPFGTPWDTALQRLTAQLGEPDSLTKSETCGVQGATQFDVEWENLVVRGQAPIGGPDTASPVLVFAAVGEGRYRGPAGLSGGSTWGDFVATLPTAHVRKTIWDYVEGVSHRFDPVTWTSESYLTAGIADTTEVSGVVATTPLRSVSAGHAYSDC